jgi:hypothetical protein
MIYLEEPEVGDKSGASIWREFNLVGFFAHSDSDFLSRR